MRYSLYASAAVIAVFLIYFWFFGGENVQPSDDQETAQPRDIPQWETKTDEQAPVTIQVTPLEFGENAETWKFRVVFDTHSGSLDDDPTQVASLVDEKGSTHQPTAWDGDAPAGHHREGVLSFEAVHPTPSYIELRIKNVGGVYERSFRWSLE